MEKTELVVTMEPDRLDALRYFLSTREKSTPQKELEHALEELYEKYVPAEMREYLDSKHKLGTPRPRSRRSLSTQGQNPVEAVREGESG